MGVLEEALGNDGAAHTLQANGRTYRVRLVDQAVQTAFAKALLARACDAARELRGLMTSEEWGAHLARLNRDYMRGEYALLSPRGLEMLSAPDGMLLLASLIFDATLPELFGLFATHREEMLSKLRLVLQESFPGFGEAPVPNQ